MDSMRIDIDNLYNGFGKTLLSGLFFASTCTANFLLADLVYVANFGSTDTFSIIEVGATTSTGPFPSGGVDPAFITFNPDGRFGYISNNSSDTIAVLDTITNAIVATILVGNGPTGSDITPDGRFLYVANSDPGSTSVTVIDTTTNTVYGTVSVSAQPFDIAITPDGAFAYVTHNAITTHVSVINTSTNLVEITIPIGATQAAIEMTPDGRYAYVTSGSLSSVIAIDTSTNTIVATIPRIPASPREIAITPDGKFAYVPQTFAGTVTVIDISTNTIATTISIGVGTGSSGAAVTLDGQFVYVANLGADNVSVIDTASNTIVATILVGDGPLAVAVLPFPQPVLNLSGTQEKNDFGIVYELFNELTWTANPVGTVPTQYDIYRNGTKIDTVNGSTFEYEDHNIAKGSTNIYSIVAIDANGKESNPAIITID